MSDVTATRIVPADPASTALLLMGPAALDFWPGISRIEGVVSPLQAWTSLAGDAERRVVIRSTPPRRTPTAYVSEFSVDPEGLPPASCRLRVGSQGWLSGAEPEVLAGLEPAAGVASVRFELHSEVDYDKLLEQEIAAAAETFLDNVAAFAEARAVLA
jgi:hypothetical protein